MIRIHEKISDQDPESLKIPEDCISYVAYVPTCYRCTSLAGLFILEY